MNGDQSAEIVDPEKKVIRCTISAVLGLLFGGLFGFVIALPVVALIVTVLSQKESGLRVLGALDVIVIIGPIIAALGFIVINVRMSVQRWPSGLLAVEFCLALISVVVILVLALTSGQRGLW